MSTKISSFRLTIAPWVKPVLILVTVVGIAVLFPVQIQSQSPTMSVPMAEAAVDIGGGLLVFCGPIPHRCTLDDVTPACKTDQSKCTPDDVSVLKVIASCSQDATSLSTVGSGYGCSDAQKQQAKAAAPLYETAPKPATSCSNIVSFFSSPIVCTGRVIAAVVGSLIVSVSAWFLGVAGVLFNWSVVNGIVLFKTSIFDPIAPAINDGWTAFRDISNIVIIGMFTFIAISIILGNETYGRRALVARVIVIAVLINFSLLFTKMIIDASNFTAAQFYAATTGQTISESLKSNQIATSKEKGISLSSGYAQVGIAGAFVNFLGVTSLGDTYGVLKDGAEKLDNGWMVLIHAIFATIFLLGAAVVLLYGSFIIISRAILLIFLMIVSALAFASHLIPTLSDGQFGWNAWWRALLETAVLAPLLMVFLWITLQISDKLSGGATVVSAGSSSAAQAGAVALSQVAAGSAATAGAGTAGAAAKIGTLGNLISGTARGEDINALFIYLIVLGLLYASFKVSSSLASGISGFKWASMIPALGLAVGARGVGFVGRRTLGMAGLKIGDQFAKAGKAAGPGTFRGTMFDMMAQGFKSVGKRDFNAANTGFFGKEIAGLGGLKGKWAQTTKIGGQEGADKTRGEAFAERGKRLTLSKEELDDIAKSALAPIGADERRLELAKGRSLKEKGRLDALRPRLEANRESMKSQIEKLQAAGPPTREKSAELARRQGNLATQNARIEQAERGLAGHKERLADIAKQETDIEQRKKDALEATLPKGSYKVDEKTGRIQLNDKGRAVFESQKERELISGEEVAHKRLTNLPWVYTGQQPDEDRIASKIRKYTGDKETAKALKELAKQVAEGNAQGAREHREDVSEAKKTQRTIKDAGGSPPPSTPPQH